MKAFSFWVAVVLVFLVALVSIRFERPRIDIISARGLPLVEGGPAISVHYFVGGEAFSALAVSHEESLRIVEALRSAGKIYNMEVLLDEINLYFGPDNGN